MRDPLDTARTFGPPLRKEVDLLVVLSHLGLRTDVHLAGQVPGIDLNVGGHSHHRLFEPIVVGNTAVVQAGPQGTYLGVVDVEEDPAGSRRFRISGRIEPVWQDVSADSGMAERLDRHYAEADAGARSVLGQTPG